MKTPFYIFLLFFLTIISCKNEPKEEQKNNDPSSEHIIELSIKQFNNGGYRIEKADSIKFFEEFKVTGYIDVPPENRASINSFFSGFVSQTSLLVGDTVEKGDLLITLQNPEFIRVQQEFLENYSQLEFLESEFNRKKNLLEDKVISTKVFQQTKSDYMSMKAKVQGQRKTLELMNVNINKVLAGQFSESISIYAPIEGKVSKMNISKGMFVEQNTMIMEILNTEHIHLELDVFEKDIMKVNIADTFSFKIPELGDADFKAYVRLIGAQVSDNRSVRIHGHPVDDNQNFKVGMFVESSFKHKPKVSLSLPETAFAKRDDAWVVLKLKAQTDSLYYFEAIEVEQTKEQFGRRALEIDLKLSPQDQFLTNGVFDLVSGEG